MPKLPQGVKIIGMKEDAAYRTGEFFLSDGTKVKVYLTKDYLPATLFANGRLIWDYKEDVLHSLVRLVKVSEEYLLAVIKGKYLCQVIPVISLIKKTSSFTPEKLLALKQTAAQQENLLLDLSNAEQRLINCQRTPSRPRSNNLGGNLQRKSKPCHYRNKADKQEALYARKEFSALTEDGVRVVGLPILKEEMRLLREGVTFIIIVRRYEAGRASDPIKACIIRKEKGGAGLQILKSQRGLRFNYSLEEAF